VSPVLFFSYFDEVKKLLDRIDKEVESYGREVGRVLDKLDDLVGPEPRKRTTKRATTKRATKRVVNRPVKKNAPAR
jgi:hypothetical protein